MNLPVEIKKPHRIRCGFFMRIITSGRRLWEKDSRAALYESFILSDKTALDEARAGVLLDIQREGQVYGRTNR